MYIISSFGKNRLNQIFMISLDQKIAILHDSEIPIFFNVVILIFSFLIYLSNAMAI